MKSVVAGSLHNECGIAMVIVLMELLVVNHSISITLLLFTTTSVMFCVVCQFGIQLSDTNTKILGTFCARNERDRMKFVDDLKEAISEVLPY